MSKCLECRYYDKEKHYCPFYCQLIRETLDEAISFELEKIKSKMEVRVKHNNDLENYDIATGLSMALGILDNHISELKGEDKPTCDRDICLQNEYNNIGCEDCVVNKEENK